MVWDGREKGKEGLRSVFRVVMDCLRLDMFSEPWGVTEGIQTYLELRGVDSVRALGLGDNAIVYGTSNDAASVFIGGRPAKGRRRVRGGWRPGESMQWLLRWSRRAAELRSIRPIVRRPSFPSPGRSPRPHGPYSSFQQLSSPNFRPLISTSL